MTQNVFAWTTDKVAAGSEGGARRTGAQGHHGIRVNPVNIYVYVYVAISM